MPTDSTLLRDLISPELAGSASRCLHVVVWLPASVLDLAEHHGPEETVALDEALRRLEERDPSMARIVQLRFFAGLDVDDTARSMGVSPRTVKREWAFARAWLYRALHDTPPGADPEPPVGH